MNCYRVSDTLVGSRHVLNFPYKSPCSSGYKTFLTFIEPCIVIYFCSKTNQMHQYLKFILFWSNTLHVSDGLSVHHHEFKTVHTATGICQTDTAVCLLAFPIHSSISLTYACCCMYSFELLTMDGKTVRNMYSAFQNKINLIQWGI